MHSLQWQDSEARLGAKAEEMVACGRQSVLLWDLNTAQLKQAIKAPGAASVKRDPHNGNTLVYVAGNSLVVHDLRQQAAAMQLSEHSPFL